MSQPKRKNSDDFGVLPQEKGAEGRSVPGKDAPHAPSSGAEPESTIDRVRDLLFGEARRAQEDRTAALEAYVASEIGRVTSAFEARLERVKAEAASEREGLRADFKGEVAALRDRLDGHGRDKVERADLRSLLTDLADRVGPTAADGGNPGA